MYRTLLPILLVTPLVAARSATQEPGAVVAVGGGGTPVAALEATLALARARADEPALVVLPFASSLEDRGVGAAEMWRETGFPVVRLASDDAAEAREAIEHADVVWMSGGDQDRLLDDLERMGLVDTIRARHRAGAIVGGTSAGAAVLGAVCIAGRPDPEAYVVGGMEGRAGLGLVADVIVDQHFRERTREGRLLTAVLDAGGLLGLGLSERTAAVFDGASYRVLGEGVVVAFDARDAEIDDGEPASLRSARGVLTAVHPSGSRVSLDRAK